jgi:hypothetical protein
MPPCYPPSGGPPPALPTPSPARSKRFAPLRNAPRPQAGGRCRALTPRPPRLRYGLEPWPSAVAYARWLRPALSGVPTPHRTCAVPLRLPLRLCPAITAQPMFPHHPDHSSAPGRTRWLSPSLSRARRRAEAQHDPRARGFPKGATPPLAEVQGAEPACSGPAHRRSARRTGAAQRAVCDDMALRSASCCACPAKAAWARSM